MDELITPRKWRKMELIEAGFVYYRRKKQLVMAARLPEQVAPLYIYYPLEYVTADAGDVICFDPGTTPHDVLWRYDHWSVKYDIFMKTYRDWNEPGWQPDPQVQFLISRGCKPYYKGSGAWARRLDKPQMIQSLESPEPILVPEGMWLLIGPMGEPWHNEDDRFRARYIVGE